MSDELKAAKERYKSTVLLPKTDFPMKAGLQQKEPELQKHWQETGLYERIREARQGAKPWVLHDGPPYANGDAHTGTGMNKILKDMVVKFSTMRGYDNPYVPGWDCHGLPIEHNVLKELGGTKPPDMSNVKLRELCLEYANKFVDKQRRQFKRAGVLGRWADPYLTTSSRYESSVLRVFRDLFERGYITRAKRPVHWSWAAQSALAEAELEYEDRTDPSIYVRMMVSGSPQTEVGKLLSEKPTALLIWTTTPWTLPANRAIAVHPGAEYAVVEYGAGERLVVAEELREAVAEKAGLGDLRVLRVIKGRELEGVTYTHALWATECPVVFAEYVTLEDGTGLVHTAPGHGKEDFETGKQYGIPAVCPVSENGTYYKGRRLLEELQLVDAQSQAGPEGAAQPDAEPGLPARPGKDAPELGPKAQEWLKLIDGQHILKVNDAIVDKLRDDGLLLYTEPFPHSYPHCWRTHTPVIFRVTEQWFVNVDHVDADTNFNPESKPLRARLLDEIGRTQWFPAWGQKRISAMIENRPDWCISRQRFWGIPIPAFFDAETGEVCMSTRTIERVIDVVAEHGSNVWYDDNWPAAKLLPDEFRPDKFKGRNLTKMEDIFDVWFESGSSHRAVMLADPELSDKFPAGLYLEGDDQHRGWFQVSLILSVATHGRSPFQQCLTSAFVVDEKGEKGSKSKGNIWPIDKGCEDLGADLIRLFFAGSNTSEPIPVTYKLIQNHGDAYRKLRNTYRALASNLFDFDPEKDALPYEELLALDQWALSEAARTVEAVTVAWQRYEFHTATRALFDFANVTLSSQYIDVRKDTMYCESANGEKRRSAQTAYWIIADTLVRLLAPVLVHTAEEMWRHLPKHSGEPDSVHLASWPDSPYLKPAPALQAKYRLLLQVKGESDRILDRLRKEGAIGKGYDTHVVLGAAPEFFAALGTPEELEQTLPEVLNVSAVSIDSASDHAALQEFEPAVDIKGLWLKAEPTSETACVRCFRRTGDVGTVIEHEHLCVRCAGVVNQEEV